MKRIKRRIKKIYEWRNVLVDACKWCNGTGQNQKAFTDCACFTCGGTGGQWALRSFLVGEEVTE
jgi:DnaJ-class molecular chaperone